MGHYPCPDCCGGYGCLIHRDFFTRADTTTIPNTTELVGDWANTSNQLHPDHAASDQRIRFDPPSSDLTVVAVVRVQGQSGDRVGLALFLDADGDSFVEGTIQFGSGTSGRLYLKRYTNGVLDWASDAGTSPYCGANEYDFTPGDYFTISLWHKSVDGGSIWKMQVCGSVDCWVEVPTAVADPVYEIEYLDAAGVGALTSFQAGCVTGTDAITATFDDFRFYHAYAACNCYKVNDFPILRGAPCDYPGAEYREEEGDWDLEEITYTIAAPFGVEVTKTSIVTDDYPATLILVDTLEVGDTHQISFSYGARESIFLDVDVLRFRYFWGWSDDDNYWCVEWDRVQRGPWTMAACGVSDALLIDGHDAVRIIERLAGVETIHFELDGLELRYPFGYGVYDEYAEFVCVTPNGWVNFSYSDFSNPGIGLISQGPYTFPGTGVTGWKVMDAPSGFTLSFVRRLELVSGPCDPACDETESGLCDSPGDPPVTPDPTGCCEDLDALEVGDTAEITIYGLSYDFSAPCPGECGSGNPDYLTDLNATHTGVVVYKSDTHIIIYADTGATTDCNGLDESAKIWVWITNIGGGECEARGEIRFGENVCSVLWKTTFSAPGTCDGLVLSQDADLMDTLGLDPTNCCLQLAGDASLTVDIP